MALAISTITNSIAALTVSGLTIKDMDEVPKSLSAREVPLLIPDLDNFVSGFKVTADTFGSATTQKYTVTYTLNYLLIYAQIGTGRATLVENYAGMIQMAFSFIDAVLSTNPVTGAVNHIADRVYGFSITEWGGVSFHCCCVSLDVQEFVN